MNKLTISIVLLSMFNISNAFCQPDTSTYKSIGFGTGYYHYASINEISEPFIFSGGDIDYLVQFKSVSKKFRFDCSFNYATISRMPANLSIPNEYRLISRDDGHIYQEHSFAPSKETKNLNVTFEFYKIIKYIFFKNDYVAIGATEKTSAVLTQGNDNPELVASSLNPGFVYNVLLKHNFDLQLKSNFSVLSIYSRKPYASIEAALSTTKKSDLEFLKDHHNLSGLNDYFEVFSELNLSKKVSNHFNIQLSYAFIYLSVKSPRELSAISSIANIGVTYKL